MEARSLPTFINFVSQRLMKRFVYGEPAGHWFTNTCLPGMHSGTLVITYKGSMSTLFQYKVPFFVGSTKPGHLHSSLVASGNPTSKDPERKLFSAFHRLPRRLLNYSSSQLVLSKNTHSYFKNGGLYNSSTGLTHFPSCLDAMAVTVWLRSPEAMARHMGGVEIFSPTSQEVFLLMAGLSSCLGD